MPDLASVASSWLRPGRLVLMAAAVALGVAIALLDSSPGWDDTGVTAGLLIGASALVTAIDGRRPSVWAALVGLPMPLIEVPMTGSNASVVALAFTAIGAILGLVARRAVRGPAAAQPDGR